MRAVGCKRLRGEGCFGDVGGTVVAGTSTAKKTRLLYFTSPPSFSIFLYNSHRGKEGLLMLTIFRGAAVLFLLTAQVAIGQTGSERQRHGSRRQDAKTGSSPWVIAVRDALRRSPLSGALVAALVLGEFDSSEFVPCAAFRFGSGRGPYNPESAARDGTGARRPCSFPSCGGGTEFSLGCLQD